MANGIKGLRKIQWGKESTAGTAVAATTIWRGMGLMEDLREVVHVEESIGIAQQTTRAYIPKLGCSIELDPVEATFQQLPYLFEMGVNVETPTQDGAGTGYVYAYSMPTTAINAPATYTVEMGDNQLAQESDYVFCESFKLSGNAGEGVMMEAKLIGRDVLDTTFTPALTVPALIASDNIVFGGAKFYIDAVGGTIGSTEITGTLLSFELDVTTGLKAKYTNLAKDFDFTYFDSGSYSATMKLVFEHNASGDAQRDVYEVGTPQQMRIEFFGTALTTPAAYDFMQLIIDAAGVYTAMPYSDTDGNATIEAELQIGYDVTAALGLDFTVVNQSTTLP